MVSLASFPQMVLVSIALVLQGPRVHCFSVREQNWSQYVSLFIICMSDVRLVIKWISFLGMYSEYLGTLLKQAISVKMCDKSNPCMPQ